MAGIAIVIIRSFGIAETPFFFLFAVSSFYRLSRQSTVNLFLGCRHGCGQLVETDSLDNAKSMDYVRHQLYAWQIHCFSEMLLHNREDLVNFNKILGVFSSFHGEKSPNFSFKLLNSKDFIKYNHLNFNIYQHNSNFCHVLKTLIYNRLFRNLE